MAWYHNRLDPEFHGLSPRDALAIFASLGLTGPAWSIDAATPTP